MISGWVDRHWAKHHYRLWYDENFGQPAKAYEPEPIVATVPATSSHPERADAGVIHCPSCDSRHSVVSWALLTKYVGPVPLACPDCGTDINMVAAAAASGLLNVLHTRQPLQSPET